MSEPQLKSYVVWFVHGMYALAWGTDPDDAKRRYLACWERSIKEVEPAARYRDPLPLNRQVACPVVDVEELSIHQALDQTAKPAVTLESLAAQVAALTAALAEKEA